MKVVDVKKDVEDSGNVDGWDEKDLLLRSWISCNLKKERMYMIVVFSTTWKKLIFKKKNKESHLNINHKVLVEEHK